MQNSEYIIIPDGSSLSVGSPFPLGLLPEWLRVTALEQSASYGTPAELWATTFLCGISAAAGKRIKLVTGNYTNYPQLWLMVVGKSGSGKSDPLRVAFRPHQKKNHQLFDDYRRQYSEWISTKEGTPPRWDPILINDFTPEALFDVLKTSTKGLTLYRDELSGFFLDIGRYSSSGEVSHYLSTFDNQSFSVNRKKDQPFLVTDPYLNIVGSIQPSVLSTVLGQNQAQESGFAQRFLFLYPDFPPKDDPDDVAAPKCEHYEKLIFDLLDANITKSLKLDASAKEKYKLYFRETERLRVEGSDFWATVYSKAQIQVLRLALTVAIARIGENIIWEELFDEPTEYFVSGDDMGAAVGMMRYFIASLKKFKEEQGESTGTKKDMIQEIFRENPDANQTEVARILGVTRKHVNRTIRRLQVTGYNEPKPFTVNNYRRNDV